jgi:hypothetical protein
MSSLLQHWKVGLGALVLLAAIYGCEVAGPGYEGDGGVYVGGVYEEPGFFGGGWGGGYHVGPPRGGARDHGGGGGRRAPSIPSRSRGGGGGGRPR